MTDWEIEVLQKALKQKLRILFTFDFIEWEEISCLTNHSEESGPVAWLKNRLCQCVALYNCEAKQFAILQPIFA